MANVEQQQIASSAGDEPREAVLTFREQTDGRKVARLPGGKVVLLGLKFLPMVRDGERWRVRLNHRETFAVADPLERIFEPDTPIISPELAERLRAQVTSSAPTREESPLPAIAEAPTLQLPAVEAPSTVQPGAGAHAVAGNPDRVVQTGDRVAIFIDGANMDGAARDAGFFLDYGKALEFFLAKGTFYAAFYYIADFTAHDPLQQRFLDFLSHAGFIVRRKPVKVIRDQDTGERIIKGNLDTEIVLDMMNTADNYDLAYLFSGDSDFERAVELLRSRGKRVYVVTSRGALSRELAYVADKPIFFIEEYQEPLRRTRA